MKPIKKQIISWLSRIYRPIAAPTTIHELNNTPEKFTILTQGESWLVAALISAIAKKAGFVDSINLADLPLNYTRSQGTLYWVSIHNQKHLGHALEEGDRYLFATLNIFSARGPFKSSPYYEMRLWDQLALVFLRRRLVIRFGKPFAATLAQVTSTSIFLRKIRQDFFRNQKITRGTPFQPLDRQARAILSGGDFERELANIASRLKLSERELHKNAKRTFYTIAANPIRPMYIFLAWVAKILIGRLFASVTTNGLEKLSELMQKETVILVAQHRSHFDYILLGYKLYEADLTPPLVAAGINLSFWPVGFFIRSVGAYFVKRNIRHDRMHALILRRYVAYLIKQGHLQEFFIEGGRSRSGRMRQPRIGLVSAFVDAVQKGVKRDILFIPVSLTYEAVVEDTDYAHENTGAKKSEENLRSFLRASEIFKKQYGDVVINFGEAISLKAELQKFAEHSATSRKQATPTLEVALKTSRAIRDQSNPSLTNIVCTALLGTNRGGMRHSDLVTCVKRSWETIEIMRGILPNIGEATPALQAFISGREKIVSDFVRHGIVAHRRYLEDDVYFIPGKRRFTADFYKNGTIHLFIYGWFLAVADMLKCPINDQQIKTIYEIFQEDFLLEDYPDFIEKLSMTAEAFAKRELIKATIKEKISFRTKEPGIYNPTLLLPTIQSLIWAYNNLKASFGKLNDTQNSPSIALADLMHKMQGDFKVGSYLGEYTNVEAASASALSSALDTLNSIGVIAYLDRSGERRRIIYHPNKPFPLDLLSKLNKLSLEAIV